MSIKQESPKKETVQEGAYKKAPYSKALIGTTQSSPGSLHVTAITAWNSATWSYHLSPFDSVIWERYQEVLEGFSREFYLTFLGRKVQKQLYSVMI